MNWNVSRRGFLKTAITGAALGALAAQANRAAAAATPLPTRQLGKTGVRVPILGYGCAQVGTERTLEEGIELFQQAFEMGITYFDTAPKWAGYGKSQVQLGHAFKGRRKDIFLTTKAAKQTGDEALKVLEENLKQLQTDHVDLLYVHSIGANEMDPKIVNGPGGSIEFLQRAKREGLARFVGVTGHNRPDRFVEVLKNFDIDVMMNNVNFVDRHTYNFEEKVWPLAAEKNVGLVAMKVFGGSQGSKTADAKLPVDQHTTAFRYSLSLPNVSCAILGMKTLTELKRNLDLARSFKPMTEQEIASLRPMGQQLAAQWKDHLGKVA